MNISFNKSKIMLYVLLFLFISLFNTGCNKEIANENVINEKQTESGCLYVRGIPLNDDCAVVKVIAVDVFEMPDIRSQRLTQVLFNQPVLILSQKGKWAKVRTCDEIVGWLKTDSIIRDISSIDYERHDYRIIVISKTKNILSHQRDGITIGMAMMGTEFLSYEKVDNAYRIKLPGDNYGWISDNGTIRVPLNNDIPITTGNDFLLTAMKMKGVSYMTGGVGMLGIDSSGLIYTCALINGIHLMRELEKQYQKEGIWVDKKNILPGDIIFFNNKNNKDKLMSAGIYADDNNFIHASPSKGYVTIDSLEDEYYNSRIAGIKRIFN
jgi:gamma-D-glutamyl-L-lysine dipeptidyl-peptidase